MSVFHSIIEIQSKHENDMIDITSDIQSCISKSKLKDGICCVFVPGSTGTITTIEYEPGLKQDFPKALDSIAPSDQYYAHHETWHDDNGRSHVKASLMGPSITIPFQVYYLGNKSGKGKKETGLTGASRGIYPDPLNPDNPSPRFLYQAFRSPMESTLDGIRTHDLRLRRPLLYPAELRGRITAAKIRKS